MGILKKIKEKITGKKEEVPKIEIKEEEEKEEKEEEEERKIMVTDILIEPLPKVIEERKDTELPLIVLKDEEELIVEKEREPLLAPIEEKEEEGEIIPEEEGVSTPPFTPEIPSEVEVKEEVEESLIEIEQEAGAVIETEEAMKEISQIVVEKEMEAEEELEEPGVGITVPEKVIDRTEIIEVEEHLKKVEKEREEILGTLEEEGEVILDPKTNEVLDRELDLIAQARMITVKEKLSIALVTTKFSSTDIMPTDIVEVIR